MKGMIKARFLPEDYDQVLYELYHDCHQGLRTVNDYASEFFRLSSRNNLNESERQQVSRFICGLTPPIRDKLHLTPIANLNSAINIANRVERQLHIPDSSQRPPQKWRNLSDFYPDKPNQNRQNFLQKLGHNPKNTDPPTKPTLPMQTQRANNFPNSAYKPNTNQPNQYPNTNPNPYAKTYTLKCFTCKQIGHKSTECPQKRTLYAQEEGEEEGQEGEENDHTDFQQEVEELEGDMGDPIVCLLEKLVLTSSEVNDDDEEEMERKKYPQRHSIFRTRCTILGKVCDVIVDGGSSENVISAALVKALNVPTT